MSAADDGIQAQSIRTSSNGNSVFVEARLMPVRIDGRREIELARIAARLASWLKANTRNRSSHYDEHVLVYYDALCIFDYSLKFAKK